MSNDRMEIVADFVRGDPFLYSHYLLRSARLTTTPVDTPESLLMFAVWFLAYGRKSYALPLVVSEAVREMVTTLDARRCHALMHYVAGAEQIALAGDDLRAWYYGHAMPHLRLAPLLGTMELQGLGRGSEGRAGCELDSLFAAGSSGWTPLDEHAGTRARLLQLARGAAAAAAGPAPRVAIVGFHRSVLGLGEDARCLFDCLCAAGVPVELVDVSPAGLEQIDDPASFAAFETAHPTAPVLIFCMPAFEMMRAIANHGLTRPPGGQIRIGYWPWETTALPGNWHHAYGEVDEVWASSTFLRQVYASETAKPVLHVPLHVRVEAPVLPAELRSIFGRRFTFLTVFDFNSRVERKNPRGAIEAFRRAFPDDDDVQLVLKTIHGERRRHDLDSLGAAVADDDRFIIIDGALPRAELCGLIAEADAYLSLHRSEGFGRPVAEAMLLGTPVVATGWSGCADFLTSRTGYPVRSALRAVEAGEYPFAAGQWAEPDLDHAARLMRQVRDRPEESKTLVAAARAMVSNSLGLAAISARVRNRLASLGESDAATLGRVAGPVPDAFTG